MKPSAHAFLCKLFNVKPRDNALWSKRQELTEQMVDLLSDLSDGKLFAKFKVFYNLYL